MLKIRLQRRGKNNYATYRVVVADGRAPVKGSFVADVGSYNPHTNAFAVQQEAVTKWISQGAQPSATVNNLLITHGIIQGEKVMIWRVPQPEAATETSAPTPQDSGTPAPTPATPETTPPAA